MTVVISDQIVRLGRAGRNVATDLVSLTNSHLDLIEDDLKTQIRLIGWIFFLGAASVVACAIGLALGSLALAAEIRAIWPAITDSYSFAIVALVNIGLMLVLGVLARSLLHRISPLCRGSFKSWQESVSLILRRI